MNRSIDVMAKKLNTILGDSIVCIYLYGSVAMYDFKLGWSDIDILCLTKEVVSDFEAEQLVDIRQNLLKDEESNQYYRSFEGAIVSIDVFSLYELIKYGQLILGKDIRNELVQPTYEELKYGVRQHYQTIRKYAIKTGESLYSCGWLLDIARCIYTLRYNDIISKTKAGEWAIKENICPEGEQMLFTLQIRNRPLKYKEQAEVKEWLSSLGTSVQLFADVLDIELNS